MRHALRMLVIGWYLLMPGADRDAPLTTWSQGGAYDTAQACEAERTRLMKEPERMQRESPNIDKEFLKGIALAIFQSRCIAASDPRLTERSPK